MNSKNEAVKREVSHQRGEILNQVEAWLETPMIVLGFAWLALLIIEFRWGLGPFLEGLGTAIWAVFIVDFIVRLIIAPHKISTTNGVSLG